MRRALWISVDPPRLDYTILKFLFTSRVMILSQAQKAMMALQATDGYMEKAGRCGTCILETVEMDEETAKQKARTMKAAALAIKI